MSEIRGQKSAFQYFEMLTSIPSTPFVSFRKKQSLG